MKTATVVKRSILGVVGTACLVGATQFSAQALTFDGSSSGTFGLPVTPGYGPDVFLSIGGSRLDWGNPAQGSFSNFVEFDGTNFLTTPDNAFQVGTLTYRNGATTEGFNGDFPLSVELNFTNPAGITQAFSYLFNILNTPNTADPVASADRLRFSTAGLSSSSFNVGGVDYTLQLLGFSSDGGTTIISEFLSPEESTATAGLYGTITTNKIPTPALLPGIIGLGATAWRKRRKAANAEA